MNSPFGLIPLKYQSLIWYSKFDRETGFNYIKPRNAIISIDSSTALINSLDGPFSNSSSSYGTRSNRGGPLGDFAPPFRVDLTSFTLSFYLRVTGTETVGIYLESSLPGYRFSLNAVGLNLELHTHHSFYTFNKQTVASVSFRNVFKRNDWHFVALTYDGASKQLKLYDETANVKQERTNVRIDNVYSYAFFIGSGLRFGIGKYFTHSSAIACFSIHDQVLSQNDIALLPCACQFKDRQQ